MKNIGNLIFDKVVDVANTYDIKDLLNNNTQCLTTGDALRRYN